MIQTVRNTQPAAAPAVRQVVEPGASGGRRVVGLVFVLAATYLATMDGQTWREWISWGSGGGGVDLLIHGEQRPEAEGGSAAPSGSSPGVWIPVDETGGQPTGAGARGVSSALSRDDAVAGAAVADWIRWGLVVGCVAAVLLLHGSRPIWLLVFSLITAALVALTGYCAGGLVHEAQSSWWRPLVVASVGLGYLTHSSPRAPATSVRGVFGLLFVAAAALGAVRGWYDWWWAWLAAELGVEAIRFAAHWSEELTWLTIVLLVLAGAFCARGKPTYFLVAVLAVAVAYHCVETGKCELRTFPSLSRPGGPLVTAVDDSFSNVEAWRWVVAAELAGVSMVLLHRALGMGAINVAMALAWMLLGGSVYATVGRLSLTWEASRWIASSVGSQRSGMNAGAGEDSAPLANMGLPIRGRAQPTDRLTTGTGPTGSRDRASSPSPLAARGAATRALPGGGRGTRPIDPAAAEAATRQTLVREVTRQGWMYLTAILAGLIAASGLQMLLGAESARAWVVYALWLALGVALAAMWFADPRQPEQSWTSWVSDWTQSRHKLHAVWGVFLGTLTIAGSFALRPRGGGEKWLRISIAAALAGTVLTLVGITVLNQLGGFKPLPVWMYAGIAAGQSSLAWILLMYLSLGMRREVAVASP